MIISPRLFPLRGLEPILLAGRLCLAAASVPTIMPDKATGFLRPG